ncbi:hypothetical protein F7R25_03820 [Burkholderia stagnalis]|uniref:Uncharacterized protein n=1 Tax=Burkholderia stagnalis TaxID=1503054 RepID=A0A6L3N516_9BURK|nr:hypothetical protein [Burkholderia stagnalis]KAB0640632.1 hypothetical protein F7R25_03820 [Burkholderia stagnalis]VWB05733.1 hypothetical protein BST28156_00081 [Burkholderia stagnalis]
MRLNKKKAAIIGGSVLLASAIGAGSYFALHANKKKDDDMFAMSIPKPAVQAPMKQEKPTEPSQQASVPASTPTPIQPVIEAPKATPKRWQDMTFKECMEYNDAYNLQHLKNLDRTKDGIQALHEMEAYKPPKCNLLPDAPNKPQGVKSITSKQEEVKTTPEPQPVKEVPKAEPEQPKPHKVKKPHVEVVRETSPARTAPVQPTPQPAAKAWYQ